MTIMKVCRKCGSTEIYSSGQCAPCKRAYAAERRKNNPEADRQSRLLYYRNNKVEIQARNKAYHLKNKDELKKKFQAYREANREKLRLNAVKYRAENREVTIAYRQANREKLNAKSEAYRKANLGVFRILSHNRRARVAEVGGRLSRGIKEKLFKLQKGKCACCGLPLGDDYHLDHIVPIALGGKNIDSNIQLLRRQCNLQKTKLHPVEFMQRKGFLL